MTPVLDAIKRRMDSMHAQTGVCPSILRVGPELHRDLWMELAALLGSAYNVGDVVAGTVFGLRERIDLRGVPRGFSVGVVVFQMGARVEVFDECVLGIPNAHGR